MQPEISHRCESCGAAVREPAMFCPECGQALAQPAAKSQPQAAEEQADEQSAPPVNETAAASSGENTDNENAEVAAVATSNPATAQLETAQLETAQLETDSPAAEKVEQEKSESDSSASDKPAEAPVSKQGTYGKARDSLHRAGSAATSVARHALDDNVKRVEKIRHVSTVMFEEASYDPSLRFVLVALGLFVVFLVLLLLSKVMG
jgi:predicted RNA-binding Zn-ribbon protein involved in translation (DUF1610 family)